MFPVAITLLFTALLSGCGAGTPGGGAAAPSCPEGYFWNGTECEPKRSIVIEEGAPKPTSTSTSPTPPPAPTN
jgi:hypothetical protein